MSCLLIGLGSLHKKRGFDGCSEAVVFWLTLNGDALPGRLERKTDFFAFILFELNSCLLAGLNHSRRLWLQIRLSVEKSFMLFELIATTYFGLRDRTKPFFIVFLNVE